MPGDPGISPTWVALHPLAGRRILRLALGTSLSLAFAQVLDWPLHFIAPLFTLLILATPLPPPGLRQALGLVLVLLLTLGAGLALLPFFQHARWVGVMLLALGLFYSFYFTASGGSVLLGTFMTMGLTVTVTIGSVHPGAMVPLIKALVLGVTCGIAFVWLAHALLPDLPLAAAASSAKRPPPRRPEVEEARRSAMRSLLVVLPVALLFLFLSGSASYTVVMIKVASMGQQANADKSREFGGALLQSTFWGGLGAIIGWELLCAVPSLVLYVLFIALASLLFGRGIFKGATMHPKFSMWSYALLTLVVVLAPAVQDMPGSTGAAGAFWSRMLLVMLAALYGSVAVAVYDVFWPARRVAPA